VTATVRLTDWTACGGCAAKWGAGLLDDLLAPLLTPPLAPLLATTGAEVLVGLAPSDDAAVVRLTDDLALVTTTDFFPPVVDDPADFGAIAAANACSDVFAMGGRVTAALNIAAFPEALPVDVISAVLEAACEVVHAAGGAILGGHTIRSEEPIFGLAVHGLVHPDRVLRTGGARAGDVLVLSKPLGTGLVLAGGDDAQRRSVIAGMRLLNRAASEALVALGAAVHAVTDVTGFGLAGHAWEMAERSRDVQLVIDAGELPAYAGAIDAASAGRHTGGEARNRDVTAARAVTLPSDPASASLVLDPQTSGGLLASVAPAAVPPLEACGFQQVGTVRPGGPAVHFE
jgi:selenide,water dikinase